MVKAGLRGLLGRPEADASKDKKAPAPGKKPGRPNRFQAVSVAYASKCCAAVKALAGQRFLAGKAPALPLATCTQPDECKCSFQKYDDRRDSDNRRLPGEVTKWYAGSEKRRSRSRGRRQVD